MQGQSRDGVLISMTVSDIEFAMQEGGFLFDKRRFNVAITRARSKVILVMSPTLLKSLSNDDDVNEGITFFNGIYFSMYQKMGGQYCGLSRTGLHTKISDFQDKNDNKGSIDNNENAVVRSIGIEWTNVLEISKNCLIKTSKYSWKRTFRCSNITRWSVGSSKKESPQHYLSH